MRTIVAFAAAITLAATSAPALAQVASKPETPSILFWTPQQQSDWYRSIETVYKVNTIKAGRHARKLPRGERTLDPTFTHDGKTYTVESYMAAYNVSGVLVMKDGKVLMERYAMGRKAEDRWTSFSVAKSVTSTLVGAAIQDGYITGLSAPVTDYIPELKGSGYDGVTVRHLLMMSSGVKWNEDYTDPNSDVARSVVASTPGMNPTVSYMRNLPRLHEPGTFFNYNTGETDLVGILVTKATGMTLAKYASKKIWKPAGLERDGIWMVDASGQERGGCCISMTLRDYARVGQFVLEGGVARGRQVLPTGWSVEATSSQITNGIPTGYGYFWWMRPNGAYEGVGIFGQSVSTFRDDRVIIVINSAWPRATGRDLSMVRTAFINALRAAANES